MANFSDFTLDNGGITDLNKVLFATIFKYSSLFNTCTAMKGVKNGQKADAVDKLSDIGWTGRSCSPTYKTPTITGFEQTWALGNWSAPLKFCYAELAATIAKYGLRTGTDADNIQGTEFWQKIYTPLFEDAVTRMYWRMSWFADTAAKNVTNSGVITDGKDVTLFTMADGFWKRMASQISGSAGQKTTIAANAQSTYATQISALRTDGVAIGIVDSILADANSLIKDGVLMVTKSLADALRKDYRREYKATIPFYEAAEGVQLEKYDGVFLLPVPEWDDVIRTYEDDGTKWNNPHRAVFANPENLLVGTEDKDLFADFDTGFNNETRVNYSYAASNIGTLITEPTLFQAAY